MHDINVLLYVQVALVTIGVTFQIIAMTAHRRNASYGGGSHDEPRESWQEKKAEMARRRMASPRVLPTRKSHDYYEMENTPPGVRPADLRKTARVKYVDDFKAPPPTQEGETAPTLGGRNPASP